MMAAVRNSLFLVVILICICLSRGLAERNWLNCFGGEIRPVKAIAFINSTSVKGTVIFTQANCLSPVTVQVSLTDLKPGDHGDVSGGCTSMMSHYNPDMNNHGGLTDKIRHEGDMGNIQANADGMSSMTIVDNYITLSGSRSIIGRGLVIHEKMDDLGKGGASDSLTTGNAGGRIGCGVIGYM
ncbi:superoxide dismutase [Cu-Zn], chloroplastic-like isoform X2 [Bradysia coprophila]|uniref:superoxide dismutase [Cu-Zn], chloroplastic-like isoform X2 n=1 Tax=Bradysia coprophila TaxID=38358 RepID=UPI00187D784B|nr:superoxide dismutase [Cu-Zn], chloroplastic-like isoform X2 [Bradysia coprophila]